MSRDDLHQQADAVDAVTVVTPVALATLLVRLQAAYADAMRVAADQPDSPVAAVLAEGADRFLALAERVRVASEAAAARIDASWSRRPPDSPEGAMEGWGQF